MSKTSRRPGRATRHERPDYWATQRLAAKIMRLPEGTRALFLAAIREKQTPEQIEAMLRAEAERIRAEGLTHPSLWRP